MVSKAEMWKLANMGHGNRFNNYRIQKKIENGRLERLAKLRTWIKEQEVKHGKKFPGTFQYVGGQLLLKKEDGKYGQLPHEFRQDTDLEGESSQE